MKNERQTVLIVDDEEDLTWSIARRLGNAWEHIDVFCANSGMEALDILEKQNINLLITDIRMPEMDGIQLVSKVKSKYPDTRIVFMSAYGSMNQTNCDLKSMDIFLEKPFEMDALKKMIQKILSNFTGENGNQQFCIDGPLPKGVIAPM